MYNGYVRELSEEQRLANEVAACLELVELYPNNKYWQNRLANALIEEHRYTEGARLFCDAMADLELDLGESPTDTRSYMIGG